VSAISRAIATARARASVVFRVCERSAEYTGAVRAAGLLAAVRAADAETFAVDAFWVVVRAGVLLTAALAVDRARDFVAAAAASAGENPIPTRLASTRAAQSFDILINGQPLMECDTRVGRRRSF
jgi:hypothetical protein